MTEGILRLDSLTGGFEQSYVERDSCEGRVLSNPSWSGGYTQDGAVLLFFVPSVDQPVRFTGVVLETEISVTAGTIGGAVTTRYRWR